MAIEQVYHRGLLVAQNAEMLPGISRPEPAAIRPSMNVDMDSVDWKIPARGERIRIIDIVPDQIITRQSVAAATVANGYVTADPSRDVLKIAVVERHHASGNIGLGFVRGLGLKEGAVASSVAHDSHNIIAAGTNDEDLQTVLEAVTAMGGGLAVASAGKNLASLPLPIAGLMSTDSVAAVNEKLTRLIELTHTLGCGLPDPFMTLSFLALPVIPELKITDKGLIDVNAFTVVPLFVDS
jgi:adenine deaminase